MIYPSKVSVLRNGEKNLKRAVSILYPMKKERSAHTARSFENSNESPHPHSQTFLEFLDKCTERLRLPSAARKVFTEKGTEVVSMQMLAGRFQYRDAHFL